MSELLFVYGSLRRKASNDWRMSEAQWVGPAEVAGILVKIDWYPGLALDADDGGFVKGEVYEVSGALLQEIDQFEGIGRSDEYRRVKATAMVGHREQEVWIYEWLKGIDGYEVIESGDWLSL